MSTHIRYTRCVIGESIEALFGMVFELVEDWSLGEVAGETFRATFEFDSIEDIPSFLPQYVSVASPRAMF